MKKVVLIDDDEDDQQLFADAIHRAVPNVNFEYFSDGKAALKAICETHSSNPAIIFLDINMPGMNGLIVAEKLTSSDCEKFLIVVYSTTITESDRSRFLKLGVKHFEEKPVNFPDLVNMLKRYMTSSSN